MLTADDARGAACQVQLGRRLLLQGQRAASRRNPAIQLPVAHRMRDPRSPSGLTSSPCKLGRRNPLPLPLARLGPPRLRVWGTRAAWGSVGRPSGVQVEGRA